MEKKPIASKTKKRELDELRKEYIREKGYSVEEMWECSSRDQFKNNLNKKNCDKSRFPSKDIFLPIHCCKTLEMKQCSVTCNETLLFQLN